MSRLHNGFIFMPCFRGPPRGPGPRAPKLLRMALLVGPRKVLDIQSPWYCIGLISTLSSDGFHCEFCKQPQIIKIAQITCPLLWCLRTLIDIFEKSGQYLFIFEKKCLYYVILVCTDSDRYLSNCKFVKKLPPPLNRMIIVKVCY